jgi:hypothetical protein
MKGLTLCAGGTVAYPPLSNLVSLEEEIFEMKVKGLHQTDKLVTSGGRALEIAVCASLAFVVADGYNIDPKQGSLTVTAFRHAVESGKIAPSPASKPAAVIIADSACGNGGSK